MSACNARPPGGHPLASWMTACHMRAGHDGPHTWELEPSRGRRGLDRLLATMSTREVASIDSQQGPPMFARDVQTGKVSQIAPAPPPGPWIVVRFVGGDEYAVWKATGDVYRIGPDGAVEDDPLIKLAPHVPDERDDRNEKELVEREAAAERADLERELRAEREERGYGA